VLVDVALDPEEHLPAAEFAGVEVGHRRILRLPVLEHRVDQGAPAHLELGAARAGELGRTLPGHLRLRRDGDLHGLHDLAVGRAFFAQRPDLVGQRLQLHLHLDIARVARVDRAGDLRRCGRAQRAVLRRSCAGSPCEQRGRGRAQHQAVNVCHCNCPHSELVGEAGG
jgi:hypothetical protein